MGDFSNIVQLFVNKAKADIRATVDESVKKIIDEMQTPVSNGGDMPVKTGFLRDSLVISEGSPVAMHKVNPGQSVTYNKARVDRSVEAMTLGRKFYASWTAEYAGKVYYGANGMSGRQWAALANQRWPELVKTVFNKHRAGRTR